MRPHRAFCALSASLAALFCCALASAQTLLQNDGFNASTVAFQGFQATEIGAVRLEPDAGTYRILDVQFLFGGATTTQVITLHLWEDVGTDDPSDPLFSADFEVTGSDNAMQQIDLSLEEIEVSGPFRVGIEFQHTGLPSIARDDDGIDEAKNFILADNVGWDRSSDLGVTGDWIIRATVDEQAGSGGTGGTSGTGGTPGAGGSTGGSDGPGSAGEGGESAAAGGDGNEGGSDPGATGGADTDGNGDVGGATGEAGEGNTGSGGGPSASRGDCGCRLPGSGPSKAGYAWVFGLLGVAMVARRRGRSLARLLGAPTLQRP